VKPYQRLLEGSVDAVTNAEFVKAAEEAVDVFVRGYEIR
jgi:hypothetical protein